ncbi:MAG TPA: EVE domain-containing protein [Candidatus Thermoplasmatota archaeon]|nr:EVE domain-containing protein [Candidatus Thermoplasmatota archaeon]
MPAHWLCKTEPHVYSIDDLARDRKTCWDGVRNYAARNHLRAMRKGDLVFVYHSNADPSAVVGVAAVAREAYADPTQFAKDDDPMHYDPKSDPADPIWSAVDLAFREKLANPVSLELVKRTPALARMALVRLARLSVQPVTAGEWAAVLRLARRKSG